MKPLFKNITKYNRENYHHLLEFHQNKFGTKIIVSTFIMLIFYLYIFIQNIIYKNWKMLCMILIATIAVILTKEMIKRIKKEDKTNKKRLNRNQDYIYNFYPYYFKVRIGRKGQTIFYFKLYKVYETKEEFYLYTDKDHSLIVNKNGFTIGNSRSFSNFIKKKCMLKYKNETK